MVITSGEAVLGVAEKRGSGSAAPGVYGNPKAANGKQWGGETRRKPGAAQKGDQAHGTSGTKEPRQTEEAGRREASWGGKLVACDGVPWRTRLGSEGPPGPVGEWLVRDFQTGNGSREGRCDGSKKNTARTSSGPAVPDETQGGNKQLKGGKKRAEEKDASRGGSGRLHSQSRCFFLGPMISWVVALHTVLDTAEPVTLCWAAVIRSVKLWPDISAAPPPPLPFHSRRGLGPPKAGGPPPPTAPPTPTGSLLRLLAWGGAQGCALLPSRERTGSCHPRGQARCRALPCPRLGSAHPFPGQLEPGRVRGTSSCRKMAAPGSSSELSGLPRVT